MEYNADKIMPLNIMTPLMLYCVSAELVHPVDHHVIKDVRGAFNMGFSNDDNMDAIMDDLGVDERQASNVRMIIHGQTTAESFLDRIDPIHLQSALEKKGIRTAKEEKKTAQQFIQGLMLVADMYVEDKNDKIILKEIIKKCQHQKQAQS